MNLLADEIQKSKVFYQVNSRSASWNVLTILQLSIIFAMLYSLCEARRLSLFLLEFLDIVLQDEEGHKQEERVNP